MSSLRPLATIVLLAIVGYVLYLKINQPEPELPTGAAARFDEGPIEEPRIDMAIPLPAAGSSAYATPAEAPKFGSDSSSQTAPPLLDSAPPPWQPPANDPPTAPAANFAAQETRPTAPASSPPGVDVSAGASTAGLPPLPDMPPPHAAVPAPSVNVPTPGAIVPPSGADGGSPIAPPAAAQRAAPPTASRSTSIARPAADDRYAAPTPRVAAPVATETPSMFASARTAINVALEKKEFARAHLFLSQWHGDPSLTAAEKEYVAGLLSQLAGTVIYSTEHFLEPPYVVQRGETLIDVAQKYQIPWQLLAKINGVRKPELITPGQTLKVVRGPFSSVIDLSDGELTLLLEGRYAGKFPVEIGSDAQQAEGYWVVDQKLLNPAYVTGAQSVSGGDPSNPLGPRMLMLTNSAASGTKIGIHGPAARPVPGDLRGYIRLSSEDVGDVFDIMSIGSRVVIRR